VGKPSVTPDRVQIVGPETAVKRAVDAVTETISVAGLRDSISEDTPVGLLDPSLRLKTQRTVSVTVKIAPGPTERTIRGRAVHLRNLGARLSATADPPVVDVTVRGTRDGVNQINPDDIAAYLDASGLGAGEYDMAVRADAFDRAGVVRIEPASVHVRITSAGN